jgi:hypothetical protein
MYHSLQVKRLKTVHTALQVCLFVADHSHSQHQCSFLNRFTNLLDFVRKREFVLCEVGTDFFTQNNISLQRDRVREQRVLLIWSLFRCVRIIAKAISFVMYVRPTAWNNSAPTGRISIKLDIFWNICRENSSFVKIRQ